MNELDPSSIPVSNKQPEKTVIWSNSACENGEEKFLATHHFILVYKPIRVSKPDRDLSALAIRDKNIKRLLPEINDVYKMRLDPAAVAGHHYHRKKTELIYPITDIEIFFQHVASGITDSVYLPERASTTVDTTVGLLIRPGVAHTIRNPSPVHDAYYIVLSNMLEEEASKTGDIIDHQIDLDGLQPPRWI